MLTPANMAKPQDYFIDTIDNRNGHPWKPRIKEKPNALKPLFICIEVTEDGYEFSHPYKYELDTFWPPQDQLNKTKIVKPKLINNTPLIEINRPVQLLELIEDLSKFRVIAVDVEHHSYRSFMGITCLLQISTLEKDYLIDTLSLRNKLWVLNEIFTDPDIVKVFHGGEQDIKWLQRDLSLYVVNMFDTCCAAKKLKYYRFSLAYLLLRFCNIIPNKQYQLADWRIRPLPDKLKDYAREDTHYLIYIYQNMRNELIDEQNYSLESVIHQSTELCKMKYVKPVWRENSYLKFYRQCDRVFDDRQMFALKNIFKWRDQIAREEDESVGYVLPNNMLLEICERLPPKKLGIVVCCDDYLPPLVMVHLSEIHKIILNALGNPFEEPILEGATRVRGKVGSPLHLTQYAEFRPSLPTAVNCNYRKEMEENTTVHRIIIYFIFICFFALGWKLLQ